MFVKTQCGGTLVNMGAVESIRTVRPAEHTVMIEAETPQGTRYNLATAATRPEAREIIDALLGALADDSPIFDLEEYAAARMEREAGKRAAETRREYHRHWAATQGRKVEKSDNGAALDWDNCIAGETQANWEKAEEAAGNTDIIYCNYPEGAPGVIVTQNGATIAEPADWHFINTEPTPQGNIIISLVYHALDAAGDFQWDNIGIYPPDRIARIFRDLRDAIENQRPRIIMPEA